MGLRKGTWGRGGEEKRAEDYVVDTLDGLREKPSISAGPTTHKSNQSGETSRILPQGNSQANPRFMAPPAKEPQGLPPAGQSSPLLAGQNIEKPTLDFPPEL